MTNLTIANTILAQLGGTGRLSAMLGAHSFIGSADNALTFKFKARVSLGYQCDSCARQAEGYGG